MRMTEQQLRDFARDLIIDAAKDVDYLSVFEHREGRGDLISQPDALRVHDLIQTAHVSVDWEVPE